MITIRKSVLALIVGFALCSFGGFVFLLWSNIQTPSVLHEQDPYDFGPDILCIGNSITEHPINDYWFGKWGMAATSKDTAYPYQLKKIIEEQEGGALEVECINFSTWEMQSYDRFETLSILEPYLVPCIKLVCVQLGENISDSSTYYEDLVELLLFIRERCPDAKIIVIGDFWDRGLDELEAQACLFSGCAYVSLEDLRKSPAEYTANLGDNVCGEDGEEHPISHEGAASHPNNKAHRLIAERIAETYQNAS